MTRNWLSGILIIFLMLSYINRGLFVDMSEACFASTNRIPYTEDEINSVLELIFALTGNANDIDEDGDSPESYGSFSFTKPLICHDFARILEQDNLFSKNIKKTFFITSDAFFSLPVYGQIDHPPQG